MCVTVKMENTEQKCVKVNERTHLLITLNISTHGCENRVHRTEYSLPHTYYDNRNLTEGRTCDSFGSTQLACFFLFLNEVFTYENR